MNNQQANLRRFEELGRLIDEEIAKLRSGDLTDLDPEQLALARKALEAVAARKARGASKEEQAILNRTLFRSVKVLA
jgi:hypothetical protein